MERPVADSPPSSEALAVSARELTRYFGATLAVDRVNLQIRRGEIFGIVGPDGAGKTTLMRMLCAVLLPTSGKAQVCGWDVEEFPQQVRERIGYLSQQFSLYGDLTVWENIAFRADLCGVPDAVWRERAEKMLAASRMSEFRHRQADHLSGGMRQKLALTCALIHEPEVVFMDEPTTGVDPISRREFWTILYGLPARGVTVVVTTPYMDEAERCMRLVFMRDGQVLGCDTPQRLKEQVPGVLVSMAASPRAEAKRILFENSTVRHVTSFGSQLHVLLHEGSDGMDRIVSELHRKGVRVESARVIPSTLEDVFVHLSHSDAGD